MRSEKPIIVIAVAIVAVLLAGEAIVYTEGGGYSASAERDGDSVHWSAGTSGTATYDVVVSDNGDFAPVTSVYLYLDDGYGGTSVQGKLPVGSKELTPSYYLQQLEAELDYRGTGVAGYVDAQGLRELVSDTAGAPGRAVVMVSGSIPDTVYGGNSLLSDWLVAGGTLYWAGGEIGRYVSHSDGEQEEVSGGAESLIGSARVNPAENDSGQMVGMVDGVVPGDPYRGHLGLRSNCVLYGIETSSVTEGIGIGYTDGTYASAAFVRNGSGQVCVVGGDLTNYQRYDMSQIIASGICWCSQEAGFADGSTRGDVSGTVGVPASAGNLAVYIYLGHGEDFPTYGRSFDL